MVTQMFTVACIKSCFDMGWQFHSVIRHGLVCELTKKALLVNHHTTVSLKSSITNYELEGFDEDIEPTVFKIQQFSFEAYHLNLFSHLLLAILLVSLNPQ